MIRSSIRSTTLLTALALGAGLIACSGPGPQGPSPATATITATPATIQPGDDATLSWTVQNAANTVLITGSGSAAGEETVALTGTRTVTPASTTTYTISARNAAGTQLASDSATVTVTSTTADEWFDDVAAVATGLAHTVVIREDGTIWAWGNGGAGQLGTGGTSNTNVPVRVSTETGLETATHVAAGTFHTVVIATDGTVWGWGENGSGQLGTGDTTQHDLPVPVSTTAGLEAAIHISTGSHHTVVIADDGSLWAWGGNSLGQLGTGNNTASHTPVRVSTDTGLDTATYISAGSDHTVALAPDDTLWTWGANVYGQLGTGDTANRNAPVQVDTETGLESATYVAAGDQHTLAIASDGAIWAWGNNGSGRLGTDDTEDRHSPAQVVGATGLSTAERVSGGREHTVAIATDGALWAWGHNGSGRLGTGDTTHRHTPTRVSTDTGLVAAERTSLGNAHSVAITSEGSVWTWGSNSSGQLGTGDPDERREPTRVVAPAGD